MKAIRWLSLFGEMGGNLTECIRWELSQKEREVCVEVLKKDKRPRTPLRDGQIGLIAHPKAVKKVFDGDVWSVVAGDGKLVKNRRPCHHYKEGWAVPKYIGIALYVPRGTVAQAVDPRDMATLRWYSKTYKLPVYVLDGRGSFTLLFGGERKVR